MTSPRRILTADAPVGSLDAYRASGGGRALEKAVRLGPDWVIDTIRAAGLRGRGGGGFPTGIKWDGLRAGSADRKFFVCNAAEGEPGSFKDRWLMRTNPYQLLEGIAIGTVAVGAERAYIGIKASFTAEKARLTDAAAELQEAGLLEDVRIDMAEGPDDYLFGEEKAMLEVIEGADPLPRLYPPYVQGLFEERGGEANPAVVNNVETISNVPHIVANGAEWFRSFGTSRSPGTMVFTVSGDVRREAVAELELGTPLSFLLYAVGEGLEAGRRAGLIVSGVSNRPLPASRLDVPLSYEDMEAAGSGLGAGGFIVYDDTVCIARVGAAFSAFLFTGSCGQCPPCKLGTEAITQRFTDLAIGDGSPRAVEEISAWLHRVSDANRCGLGAGQRALAAGLLADFAEDIVLHLDGGDCGRSRRIRLPLIVDWDEAAGRFEYADPGHAAS